MADPIINLGILAHADAGKTTITEQLLLAGGAIRQAGNVDEGTTQTDWLDVERTRGISVRSASTVLRCGGVRVQVIDTPGHVDFLGEVERCLTVLDGAVLVLSAVEGVQAQTRLLWRAFGVPGHPHPAGGQQGGPAGLRHRRRGAPAAGGVLPPAAGHPAGGTPRHRPVPNFGEPRLLGGRPGRGRGIRRRPGRSLFGGPAVDRERLLASLRKGVADRQVFPLLFASAKLGRGIPELLRGITQWLPFAPDREEEPLSAVVFQVDHDPAMGKAAHLRVFAGSLKNRDSVPLPRGEGEQKITQIRRFHGQKSRTSGSSTAGRPARCTGCPPSGPGTCWGLLRPGNPAAWQCPCCRSRPSPNRRRNCPGCWRPWGSSPRRTPCWTWSGCRRARRCSCG